MTRYHAHRRGPDRSVRTLLTAAADGAVFLFCLGVILFMLWMVSP